MIIATNFGFRHFGKKASDMIKHFGVSSGIGTRCSANRRLINRNNFIHIIQACHSIVGQRHAFRFIKMIGKNRHQCLVDQRAFTTSTHTRYRDEFPQRDFQIHILKIMPTSIFYGDGSLISFSIRTRNRNDFLIPEEASGH